jgi:hypothetical protein
MMQQVHEPGNCSADHGRNSQHEGCGMKHSQPTQGQLIRLVQLSGHLLAGENSDCDEEQDCRQHKQAMRQLAMRYQQNQIQQCPDPCQHEEPVLLTAQQRRQPAQFDCA